MASREQTVIEWAKKTYGVDLKINVGMSTVTIRHDMGRSWAEMIIPLEHWKLTPVASLVSELTDWFTTWGIKPIEEQEELAPPPKKKRVRMGKWRVKKALL